MVSATRRSLLDPVPGRGRLGTTRDLLGDDRDDDEGSPRSLYRSYCDAMMSRHGRVPTLEQIVGAAWDARRADDDGKRNAIFAGLRRTMTEAGGGGGLGGFLVAPGMAEDVLDRARMVDGPWNRCNWWPVTTREWWFPAVNESSRSNTGRWGGFTSAWGHGETVLPSATDAKVSQITFVQNRLLIYEIIGADLFDDSDRAKRWLSYTGMAEIRQNIENAMINGPGSTTGSIICPNGAINSPCTVIVAKQSGQTSGTIVYQNIDNLWAAIYGPCKRNAVWHCNDATFAYIDGIASGGQWSESMYQPQGVGGNPFPLLKGRPLLTCEACPNVGSPGDLICTDWSQYVMTYLKPTPQNSPLSFNFAPPPLDNFHTGMYGLPEDAVEALYSSERFYDLNEVALRWKFRGDGRFLWNNTMTDGSGNTVGPCAVIAKR